MRAPQLYVVVFIAGAAVLALEILGTRILGPFYGVSLFLWSALIAATLIALSIGYAVGGRWADRGPTLSRLYGVLAAAGVWTLLIPWLKRPVLMLAEPFGLRAAVLVSACTLFVPPLMLLGMVSPYAIRLRASSLDVVGRSAGDLYAVSTVGSVIAAVVTGFVLIPTVGVNRLTLLIGATLVFTGALGLAFGRGKAAGGRSALLAATLLLVPAWAYRALPSDGADPERGLVSVRQSPYAELRVVDMDGLRYLLIDGGVHTIVDLTSGKTQHPYIAAVELARHFFTKPGDMLLIGLGGGSLVKSFAEAGWRVTAVEIDPVVAALAREYFGLSASHGTVHTMDGRRFLTRTDRTYQLMVMDAFGSSAIPFHLITDESFGLAASRLTRDGIFVLNLEVLGWDHPLARAATATLRRHFQHVLALPVNERLELGNLVLLASNRELTPVQRWTYDFTRRHDRNRYFAWTRRFVPEVQDAAILSDDLSPVDVWAEEINRTARKELHGFFSTSGLSW
jgi:spermidine synthase